MDIGAAIEFVERVYEEFGERYGDSDEVDDVLHALIVGYEALKTLAGVEYALASCGVEHWDIESQFEA